VTGTIDGAATSDHCPAAMHDRTTTRDRSAASAAAPLGISG
jgi:hypothetical protein